MEIIELWIFLFSSGAGLLGCVLCGLRSAWEALCRR